MSTSIITASYNNAITVSFTNDAWFNATEVAKQYNKRPNDWLKLESTKEYVTALHSFLFPNIALQGKIVTEQNQLVRTKTGGLPQEQGSWFHPKLAIAFARWLSVDFSIWCDMQIEKILKGEPVQRDFVNEPLKIERSTVEQRKPLTNAVNYLIYCAKDNGKELSQERIYKTIQFRMGIDSVEELTVDRIQEARAIVGEIFQKVVIEGEYIAKGEAEPEQQAKVEPEIPSDPFTNREREQLQKIVGSLSEKFHFNGVWNSAIHYRLRQATGRKSPEYYRVSDKSVMVKEFEKIFTIVNTVQELIRKVELESAKRLMRNDEEFETVIAEIRDDCGALISTLEGEVKTLLDTVDRYQIEQFSA